MTFASSTAPPVLLCAAQKPRFPSTPALASSTPECCTKSRVPHPSRLLRWAGRITAALPLLLLFLFSIPSACPQSLYAQSLQTALTRANPNLEFLLFDLRTHETLANTFAPSPIPVGSLLKPFLALAYARTHPGPFPTVVCHGHPDRCWKPLGHGSLNLPEAIAQSCNAYFLALASSLTPAGLAAIPYLSPPPTSDPATLIGLTPGWRLTPETLVHAYAALLTAPPNPTQSAILAGMRASALHGTASRIGHHSGGILAKTGTAPCIETNPTAPCLASGDGLVIAAAPATQPTLLLLVRRRATTGASTALSAARILTQLETLHAE